MPRGDQRTGIDEVLQGLENHDRVQMYRPCASGKTLIDLKIIEESGVNKVLVTVPSLSLMKQVRDYFLQQASRPFDYKCVCSQLDSKQNDGENDTIAVNEDELGGRAKVTTNPDDIADFLNQNNGRIQILFSTYQSLDKVAEALAQSGIELDLAIADEAHKTAGRGDKEFALIHDNDKLPIAKRIYQTATPRVVTKVAAGKAEEEGLEIACMSDEAVFGPVVHEMTYKQAIEADIISDYHLVAVEVDINDLPSRIQELYRQNPNDPLAQEVINMFAVQKTMNEYDTSRLLSFHSTTAQANALAQVLDQEENCQGFHVNGTMLAGERERRFQGFVGSPNKAVLTNARCLTEGVDIPQIDVVFFADRRSSPVDVTQAVGRVMRKDPANPNKIGIVAVPIIKDKETSNWSNWEKFIEIVIALAEHDDRMISDIDSLAKSGGGGGRIDFLPSDPNLTDEERQRLIEAFNTRLIRSAKPKLSQILFFDFNSFAVRARELSQRKRPGDVKRWFDEQSKAGNLCGFDRMKTLFKQAYPNEKATNTNIGNKIWG